MGGLGDIIAIVVIIAVTMFFCYFLSGLSNLAGTIFERKSDVGKK